ncbi:MAG: GntR family transcriptional regulator [Planctomycetota bacterium]
MQKRLIKDPVYKQLNEALRDLIRSGEFKVGSQFPTERKVAERFGVSRATANKALSNLVAEGVLEFKKGVGTFVRGGVLGYDLRSLVSFTEKALAAGKKPSTRVLKFDELSARAAGVEVMNDLRVKPDEPLQYIERLRLTNGTPVILERRYLVARFCPDLNKSALQGSLYALWAEHYKLDIVGADQTIRAVSIQRADARLMNVKSGTAGLLVASVGYLSGGVPLWRERTLYRGDSYEFRNRLGPLLTARPAAGTLLDLTG